MSIAGGLFNANHKKDDIGDTKSTADGESEAGAEPTVDLTTSLPGFDDDADEGLLIETGGEFDETDGEETAVANEDVESVGSTPGSGEFDFDVDAPPETPLDPES